MAKPSEKSKGMSAFLDQMVPRTESIQNNVCVFCKEPSFYFDDELSAKEYLISGLCQFCQNEVFGEKDYAPKS